MADGEALRPATAESVEQLTDLSELQQALGDAQLQVINSLLEAAREDVDDLVVRACDQVVGTKDLEVSAAYLNTILSRESWHKPADLDTAATEVYEQALDPERLLDSATESPDRELLFEMCDTGSAVAAARATALKVTGGTISEIPRRVDQDTGRTILGDSRYDGPSEAFHVKAEEAAQRLEEELKTLFGQYLASVGTARKELAAALETADRSVPDPVPAALEAARQVGTAHRNQALAKRGDKIPTLPPGQVAVPTLAADETEQ